MVSLLALLGLLVHAEAVAPTIVQIVADDLGWDEVGWHNDGRTYTPHMNALIKSGIELDKYYTYKVCSPTRASLMTGRYPWGVGFYDMKGEQAVPVHTSLLPAVLKAQAGYRTAALGKWNIGMLAGEFTPTMRGFDSFLGYYAADQSDYWYHLNGINGCPKTGITDLSNSTAQGGFAGIKPASDALNGTYNANIFQDEAIRIIRDHGQGVREGATEPLYIYLAFENVHSADVSERMLNAPCSTIEQHYGATTLDAWKTQGGCVTELDAAVGKVHDALEAEGLPYVIVFVSDNGGELYHGANAPLRGGKHSFWEGGVNVVSFVAGSVLPTAARGTKWRGMSHSSDWYTTIVEGIAGASLPAHTGPRAPDGFNLWPSLLANEASPRNEVVHQVVNDYTQGRAGATGIKITTPAVIMVGQYKYMADDPGGMNTIQAWPQPGSVHVAYGASGGVANEYPGEQDHCRSTRLTIENVKGCKGGCLFDLDADPTESKNLIADPKYADILASLMKRVADVAKDGPDWAQPVSGSMLKTMKNEICEYEQKNGYSEPVRERVPPPTPPPPPSPTPPPGPGPDSLNPGDRINSGERLVSAGSTAHLEMQKGDGNLVLYTADGAVIWSSHTSGHPGSYVTFHASDGNLVLQDSNKTPLWNSGAQQGAAEVVLQDDCDLVTKDVHGKVLWSLGTSCTGGVDQRISMV